MKAYKNIKRYLLRIALNLLLVTVFTAHVVNVIPQSFLRSLENYLYDIRVQLDARSGLDPRIVIVDIDEKSLRAEGHWPWSRNKLALLLDTLFDKFHVQMVGFDVMFAEPDESSGLKVLRNLAENELRDSANYREHFGRIQKQLDYDAIFAESIARHPVILSVYFNELEEPGGSVKSGTLPQSVFSVDDLHGEETHIPVAKSYVANLELFQSHALDGGHINNNNPIDVDGVIRRVPLFYEYDGRFYKSLSLAIAQHVLGIDVLKPVSSFDPAGNYRELEEVQLGRHTIPVDGYGMVLVPYRGKRGSYPYVSATDVLQGQATSALPPDAIVLIGTTVPGLSDLKPVPVDRNFPGVEVHANLIAGILDQRIKAQPAYMQGAEFIVLLVLGLPAAILLPILSPVWGIAVMIVLLSSAVGLNISLWKSANLVLPLATTLVMLAAMLLLNMSYGFFIEGRRKKQITNLFGQYVPPELVIEMARDPKSYTQAAENRQMSVLFSDVRGFTTISERLDPKALSSLMNEFLTPLTHIIHKKHGTIDKYMGDAIMAFWGAPVPDAEHAKHALEAGLEMINKMHDLSKELQERGLPEMKIGVGINTGVMSVGNMGSEFRMAYTVLGDAVNLGSRLEGITKQYGVNIIVGEETRAAVPDFLYRKLDQVRVKGKYEPVAIYEPMGLKSTISKDELDELELYELGLKYYLRQEWDAAEAAFQGLQSQYVPRKLYQIYLDRLDYFRSNPPGETWDGIFTFTTK
jgi:adenylate cyclase